MTDQNLILYGVVSFILVEYLWELYLDFRQKKIYQKHKDLPDNLIGIITRENFDKARVYALDKHSYSMVKNCFNVGLNVILLLTNFFYWLWNASDKFSLLVFNYKLTPVEDEILQSAIFMFLLNLFSFVIMVPFSAYGTFRLEQKHGFNKQDVPFFIKDQLKGYIVNQIIMIPLICGLTYIVKIGGDYFFLYLWVFSFTVTVFLMTIYPAFIAPLFDKYYPLPEGELRTEIEKLASSIQFPLYKLYVVEGSKRSAHSNAYFYGFYKFKRIVLFDTLLKDYSPVNKNEEIVNEKNDEKSGTKEKKGCDNNEVLAVLSHEFGHWKLNHVTKYLVIMQVNLLMLFAVFGSLYKYKPMYEAFGFVDSQPVLIGLMIVAQFIFSPYYELLSFFMTVLSRRFEFAADKFAKSMGRSIYLKLALIKLNADNLGFPLYDSWYSMWHLSHPPLLERLSALEKHE